MQTGMHASGTMKTQGYQYHDGRMMDERGALGASWEHSNELKSGAQLHNMHACGRVRVSVRVRVQASLMYGTSRIFLLLVRLRLLAPNVPPFLFLHLVFPRSSQAIGDLGQPLANTFCLVEPPIEQQCLSMFSEICNDVTRSGFHRIQYSFRQIVTVSVDRDSFGGRPLL